MMIIIQAWLFDLLCCNATWSFPGYPDLNHCVIHLANIVWTHFKYARSGFCDENCFFSVEVSRRGFAMLT